MSIIKGAGISIVIPFHRYGTIDFTSLGKIINRAIKGGIEYMVVHSPFEEINSLSNDEYNAVINFVAENTENKIPLLVGIRPDHTQKTINQIKFLNTENISGIICGSPEYQNKLKQKGVYAHFKEVAGVSKSPVILYNRPAPSGGVISQETIAKLSSDLNNIEGIIDATGDMQSVMWLIQNKPEQFSIIAGIDSLILPMMMMGANGGLSLMANAYPSDLSGMIKFASNRNYNDARIIHYKYLTLFKLIEEECRIAGIKAILNHQGVCSNNMRLPLVKIKKSILYEIYKQMKHFEKEKVLSAS